MSTQLPYCFVIMPISDPDGYKLGHFKRVYEDIFKPAIRNAGFEPIRADDVIETNLIQLDLLQKLIDCPMALCDLSNQNPNVLFELGLRQAFDKPVVLVQERGTPKIFDIAPLRYIEYDSLLGYREVIEDQRNISEVIQATKNASSKGQGINSLVNLLSISKPASLREINDKDTIQMLQLLISEMAQLRSELSNLKEPYKNSLNPERVINSTILDSTEYLSILDDVIDIENDLKDFQSVKKEDPANVSLRYDALKTKIFGFRNSSSSKFKKERGEYFMELLNQIMNS